MKNPMMWFNGVAIALLVVFLGWLLVATINSEAQANYTAGYCAALNGTVLNKSTCNVDGAVVEVE